MSRHARLDAPDTLHHLMVRGIERTALVPDDLDHAEVVGRLATLAGSGDLAGYPWALRPKRRLRRRTP